MLSLQKVQELAKFHPRTWRRATIDQRNQIADTFEKTGDIRKAFASVRFSRVELSDLTFVGQRVGGGR